MNLYLPPGHEKKIIARAEYIQAEAGKSGERWIYKAEFCMVLAHDYVPFCIAQEHTNSEASSYGLALKCSPSQLVCLEYFLNSLNVLFFGSFTHI